MRALRQAKEHFLNRLSGGLELNERNVKSRTAGSSANCISAMPLFLQIAFVRFPQPQNHGSASNGTTCSAVAACAGVVRTYLKLTIHGGENEIENAFLQNAGPKR
jgi:hypothetical protein